jgi:hypothetical protein
MHDPPLLLNIDAALAYALAAAIFAPGLSAGTVAVPEPAPD